LRARGELTTTPLLDKNPGGDRMARTTKRGSMPKPDRRIRKAVFPVAGLGTRFLPATKAMPKEMLTVVDRPVIQHVVDEARAAGIEHFIFVTGRNKGVIEDHFDSQYELEHTLRERQRQRDLCLSVGLNGGLLNPASDIECCHLRSASPRCLATAASGRKSVRGSDAKAVNPWCR
jgi:hypothetical protein